MAASLHKGFSAASHAASHVDELVRTAGLLCPRPAASSSSKKANRSQGRDAKPRAGRGVSVGSLAAERVMATARQATMRGFVVTKRDPEGETQAGADSKESTIHPTDPNRVCYSGRLPYGSVAGMEEYQ